MEIGGVVVITHRSGARKCMLNYDYVCPGRRSRGMLVDHSEDEDGFVDVGHVAARESMAYGSA